MNEPKMVKLLVWNQETDEIEEIFIEEDALEAMDKADEEYRKKRDEALKREWEEEMRALRYAQDDR